MALKRKYKLLIFIALLIILIILFFTFFIRIKQISSGYVGVKSDVGGFLNDSASYQIQIVNGYVIYMPALTEVYEYPTSARNVAYETFNVLSKDGTQFGITPILAYQVNTKKVNLLYRNYRKPLDVIESIDLKNIVHNAYLTTISTFTSDSLLDNRKQVDSIINVQLNAQLDKMGLTYSRITTTLSMPDALKEIVELRARSVQNALVMESQIRETEFISKIDSIRYSALTHLAIQKMFIDKWDGKLAGSAEVPIMYRDINTNRSSDINSKKDTKKDSAEELPAAE
ncbi:MAG: SPFH domain-containing protein [Dysgonomonas sp.]